VGNITTTCGVTWNSAASTNLITLTPATTLTLAAGASCSVSFDEKINALGNSTPVPPGHIDWANAYDGFCTGPINGGAVGSGIFQVLACSVELDKQVSCDGGTHFFDVSGVDDTEPPTKTLSNLCIGFNAFGANPATNIIVRYKARNTGNVDATCFTSGILPAGVTIASIPVTQTAYTQIDQVTKACSTALSGAEPDTGSLSCQCTSGATTLLAPVSQDSATFACQSPALAVTKTCGTANASGNSAVTVSYQSTGDAALSSCVLTDNVFTDACVSGAPAPGSTKVGTVTGIPGVIADPTSSIQTVSGLTATGLNSTSCTATNCCNQATLTCDVTGSPGPETIAASNVANCPIATGGCFSRSPGYWAEHFNAQTLLYKDFGPILSCGVDLNTAFAKTQGSGTEDLCSIGGGKSNPPQTTISNTQRQIERECAAANMNLAVSSLRKVDCEAADPGITNLIDTCCNSVKNVCNDGTQGAFTTNGCIASLDVFNNTAFAGTANATDFGPPGAQPTQCKAAKASGFVNTRSRP
jgi:hypothetical protein